MRVWLDKEHVYSKNDMQTLLIPPVPLTPTDNLVLGCERPTSLQDLIPSFLNVAAANDRNGGNGSTTHIDVNPKGHDSNEGTKLKTIC